MKKSGWAVRYKDWNWMFACVVVRPHLIGKLCNSPLNKGVFLSNEVED